MADSYQRQRNSREQNRHEKDNSGTNKPSESLNKFVNDGSFMDMFRKKMEAAKNERLHEPSVSTSPTTTTNPSNPSSSANTDLLLKPINCPTNSAETHSTAIQKPNVVSFVGKRRGGRVLKTGTVKKVKKEDEESTEKKDAWSKYLDEVKKYKSQMCVDEDKTRPLVK